MSLQERNRMLEILHSNKVKRKNIRTIMADLEKSGIFGDPVAEVKNEDDEWQYLEDEANVWFSGQDPEEKIKVIVQMKKKREQAADRRRSQHVINTEKRIKLKQQELIRGGLVEPDPKPTSQTRILKNSNNRYGRSPLHEAIVMRDIRLVKKYLKAGLFFDHKDNNGHTPQEMAFYENYRDAMLLFELHNRKKREKRKKIKAKH